MIHSHSSGSSPHDKLIKASVELQNVDWEDARKTLTPKSPTCTFPFLETTEGVLSESRAIENYLALKHKPELLGENDLEKAQIGQWSDFIIFEIRYCAKEIVTLFLVGKINVKNQLIKPIIK